LKEIFELFDKDHTGTINMKDLEAIMQSLQRNPEEAKDLLRSIRME
jgi:Ca2+-binding EF-hand superfamily protein